MFELTQTNASESRILESAVKSGVRQRGTVGTISKRVSELIVEDLGSCLEQEVRSPKRPLHLLLLHESSADDLVDRRFDKAVLSLSFPLGAGGDSCSFLPEEGGKLVALFAL